MLVVFACLTLDQRLLYAGCVLLISIVAVLLMTVGVAVLLVKMPGPEIPVGRVRGSWPLSLAAPPSPPRVCNKPNRSPLRHHVRTLVWRERTRVAPARSWHLSLPTACLHGTV